MKKIFFGTDGIRGIVNKYPICPDFFVNLAYALCSFKKEIKNNKVIIGKDTRDSCQMIESALSSGFSSMGVNSFLIGIVPTPLVSFMTKSLKADFGIMISASHNPFYDNGLKIFNRYGEKLSDSEELKIERIILKKNKSKLCMPDLIGKTFNNKYNFSTYINKVNKIVPKGISFKNIKIVFDCANGSGYKIGPEILSNYGVDILKLSVTPNGKNINKNCGALYPENLAKKVIKNNADMGIAIDGDGDRLIICDERGSILDGDKILAIVSSSLNKQGKLKGGGLVATKMSNLGLKYFVKNLRLKLYISNVGDRYVVEKMKKYKCNLGGEQSGHIIFSDFSLTGDAILSALQILTVLKLENKSLSNLLENYETFPQRLVNMRLYSDPDKLLKNIKLSKLVSSLNEDISNKGSILIRKSGTENLLRIMAQSQSNAKTNDIISKIQECVVSIDKK